MRSALYKPEVFLFYVLSLLFVATNAYLLYNDIPYGSVLPLGLIVVLVGLFALDKIFWLVVLLTPFSINLNEFGIEAIGLYLPTEPMLVGIMILFIMKVISENNYEFKIIFHPITIVILLHLVWIFCASIVSENPLVSFKFLLSRTWFVIPAYFFAIQLFKKKENIYTFFWLYLGSLSLVIIYTVIQHATYGFAEKPAHWVMSPFFKDHTSYGAVLAMFYPALFGLYLSKSTKPLTKNILVFILLIFTAGLVFSYTRAAWISVIGAFGVFFLLWFRIRFSTVLLAFFAGLFTFFVFYDQIVIELERNKTDSSDNLADHITSMSNISSDASNLERINRWNCALRMWEERPVFGWGPGTYQFYYAPFQHSSELTIISTSAGDMGNAHSEYLGPLAEQGLPGMLIMVLLVLLITYKGIKLYQDLDDPEFKMLLACALLGLITYFIHGILNNYLDTDKASIPFWSFIAMIVAIDLYHRNNTKELNKSNTN